MKKILAIAAATATAVQVKTSGYHIKILILLLLIIVVAVPSSAAQWECVRWSWTGDVYNRKVICLEWQKKEERNKKK
jgi:hypothetical protein